MGSYDEASRASTIDTQYHLLPSPDDRRGEEEITYIKSYAPCPETVIVSLADAVEAASKSLDKEELEYRKIEELVNKYRSGDGEPCHG